MKRLVIILFIINLFSAACAYAAASFSVQAPRQVIQGGKFSITYVLSNASGSGFKSPNVGGCKLLYGPSVSQMSSFSSVNGKNTSSSSESYTMTYRAEKAGKYTVGAASVNVGGKTYTTKPFTLEVLPPDKSASGGNQSQSVQVYDVDTQTPDKSVGKNDVFVRIILSKSKAYEQEGILCTIKLYTKYNIQQFMPTLQPSFDGFISQELPITSSINRIENYNGENYMVADLKQCILYPQRSGTLTITSGNYDLTVIQYQTVRSGMFGMMMRTPVEKEIKVSSNKATINIVPLPEPKPADFCGAVGTFSVSTRMLNDNLKTNEAGTLRLTIKGNGNLKNIQTPKIAFPSQFDVYDPQTTVDANPSGDHLTGTVTIDYAFVPQYVGKFEIPATSFSYFDPVKNKYERISINGYELDVAKGSSSSSSAPAGLTQRKDIIHIKTGDLSLANGHIMFVNTWWYLLWYIVPLVIFCTILFYYRKLIKERANVALMKTKRANKVANKRLKNARQLMSKNKHDAFFEEMLRALWGYFSDKLTIPVSELNRDNIFLELSKYGVTENVCNDIIGLLDDCEFARYAKSEENGSDMSVVYKKACDLINQVENTKHK